MNKKSCLYVYEDSLVFHSLSKSRLPPAGEDVPYEWDNYKKYYSEPVPVFIAPNTVQGLIQHLNDMASINLGAGLLYAGWTILIKLILTSLWW